MTNMYRDKADAQKEKLQAQLHEWEAKLKEATADTRIGIQHKINELRAKLEY